MTPAAKARRTPATKPEEKSKALAPVNPGASAFGTRVGPVPVVGPSASMGAPPARAAGRNRLRAVLVVAAFVAVIVAAAVAVSAAGLNDQARLERAVDRAGLWGPLVFVLLMAGLVPLNVPGVLFVIPSTTLFGTVGGVVLSLIGGFLGSAVGIVAARRIGREALSAKLPPRLQRWDQRLADHGFWAVASLRCFTFLFQPVDWLCGVSSISLRTALAGTFVGLVPPTLVVALTGGGVLDAIT